MDRRLEGEQCAELVLLGAHDAGPGVEGGPGRDRAAELQAAGAEVHDVLHAGELDRHGDQARHETEGQETVGDRATEGAFLLAALDVDVNPLVVAGQVGELFDHLLCDDEFVAPLPVLLGGLSVDGVDVVESDGSHGRQRTTGTHRPHVDEL